MCILPIVIIQIILYTCLYSIKLVLISEVYATNCHSVYSSSVTYNRVNELVLRRVLLGSSRVQIITSFTSISIEFVHAC